MENFDTVIIGAGPGGLRCASVLANQGQKVLILERKNTIGPKICAGGIPYHARSELNIPNQVLEKSFPDQYIHTPWQKAVLRSSFPLISTVNRKKFGQWMLNQATESGTDIRPKSMVTRITDSAVSTKRNKYGYKYLVGADGSNSMVRRFLKVGTRNLGAGLNYQVPGDFHNMEWHLDPGSFRSGYAWIFPHKDSASIGLYADRNDLRPILMKQRLHAWAKIQKIDLRNCPLEAALINFDFQGWNFGNRFLVGDAAGLASGFTGEGIYPAIISGETVARTILDNSYQPDKLNRIIKQQRRHNRMQKFFTGNKVICQISLEMLVLAFRLKLLGFEIMEMH